MEEITPENFIDRIQQMSVTERRHLKLADLLNLIMAAPRQTNIVTLDKFNELLAVVDNVKNQALNNSTENSSTEANERRNY